MHIGSTISHYKIVEKLGEGGMGVVYKAEDTKLERAVALKFLAQHLLDDGEAKERFLREAKAAAALDHPNICTVYEIGESDGKTFISMAFIEGETLEARIAAGPLAIKDGLDIARQVAEGLQAAHEKSVVHRDIKPANVVVDGKGRATIMDFGLARLTEASRLTKVNTAMGTVAYMSPEQAQGMEVDGRTDTWALGCVLYEMVSGQRPFQGQYDQALLYEIVHEEPEPLTGVRAGVPMELEFIVGKCLAKEAGDRYQTASEIAVDLRTLAEKLKSGRSTILRTAQMTGAVPAGSVTGKTVSPARALPPDAVVMPRSRERALLTVAVVATLAALALGFLYASHGRSPGPVGPVTRFSFQADGITQAEVSPDGRHIAYVVRPDGNRDEGSVWLRSLASEVARELPGTLGAREVFWSPVNDTIGFSTGAELKSLRLADGTTATLCALPHTGRSFAFTGGSWGPRGESIVFSSGARLYQVPAIGGDPQLLVDRSDDVRGYGFRPRFLPSSPPSIVFVSSEGGGDYVLTVMELESGERRDLVAGSHAVYSNSGHLLYTPADRSDMGLRALPFSLETLTATGEAFPINAAAEVVSVSLNGTIAYVGGSGSATLHSLVWRDRDGTLIETLSEPQPDMSMPSLSPDARRVAVTSTEAGTQDVWLHDLTRSTKTRLTFGEEQVLHPAWSPDGSSIIYESRGSTPRLMRQSADGAGEPSVLVEGSSGGFLPNPEWSSDGRYVVYQEVKRGVAANLRYVDLEDDSLGPQDFLANAASENVPRLSPDGRLMAYLSNESGRTEVFVRPFPDGPGRWQASTNGGDQPRWSRDGSELFFVSGAELMSVPIETEPVFALGRAEVLFESPDLFTPFLSPRYDVSPDGRFLTIAPYDAEDGTLTAIHVVENWYEEFRDREE